jgi:hypothetical protein
MCCEEIREIFPFKAPWDIGSVFFFTAISPYHVSAGDQNHFRVGTLADVSKMDWTRW